MPQINQDDGANDESKTYHDEAIGGDEGHDLNDIKGDLVCEDDRDQIQPPFDVSTILNMVFTSISLQVTNVLASS